MNRLLLISFLLIIIISAIPQSGCKGKSEQEAALESSEKKEKKNPLKFISVAGTNKRNMLGQTVVRGIVSSAANVVSYKNVRVKLLYYKTGTLVTNHEELLEEVLKPQGEINFKAKYFTPKGTDSVALSIMSAEVVQVKKGE